ncbi:glycosyltransferase [Xenorhabdus sp. PB62.4]|uniref:glycosyltransferase n=1 Tax=Xenorhabdus sp. PB62.4 TaxID=1851573 RepID=UPI0016571F9D|nr:glycosyltransferase [Xenorhabdus sp. PB62.4]MBC8954433.1 putative UDP-galactose--lipooligosaccharide galactosyltransferase [Xenorhabdus sp. PB62.4]
MKNIAVIMSIYKNDKPKYVINAIESIKGQTYTYWHLFICADGYIDPFIDKYINENLNRITYIKREKNKGLAFSLNQLIDKVLENEKYHYIARMDADDISINTRFEKQANYMKNNPNIQVLGGKCVEFGSKNARKTCSIYFSNDEIYKNIFKKCPFVHPTVLFKTEIFKQGIRYPINNPATEDIALWFLLTEKKIKFGNLNENLIKFRIDDNTILRRHGFKKAITEFKIRFYYLFILKRFNPSDIFYTFSHFIVRILPLYIFKKIYRKKG